MPGRLARSITLILAAIFVAVASTQPSQRYNSYKLESYIVRASTMQHAAARVNAVGGSITRKPGIIDTVAARHVGRFWVDPE